MILLESFDSFDEVAKKSPTPHTNQTHNRLPPWIDMKKFVDSRSVLSRHFFSIFFTHLSGLVLLVFIGSINRTLQLSGKSKDLVSIFFRYWHTIVHVRSWYEGDIFDPTHPSYQSLQTVKHMHANVSLIQNRNKTPHVDQFAISQRDMVLTQFAFIGLIVLHPSQMGFSTEKEEIERLIYFWRVVGYMLGIDDQYNLCSGDYHTVRQACHTIFQQKFRPTLTSMDDDGAVSMSQKIVFTSSHIVSLLNYNSLMQYLLELFDIKFVLRTTRTEQLIYQILKAFMTKCIHFKLIRLFINNLLRLAFYKFSSKWAIQSTVNCLQNTYTAQY